MDTLNKETLSGAFSLSEDGTQLLHLHNRGPYVKAGQPAAKDVDGTQVVKVSGKTYLHADLIKVMAGEAEAAEPVQPAKAGAAKDKEPEKKRSRVNSKNLGKKRKVESHVVKVGNRFEARVAVLGTFRSAGTWPSEKAAKDALAKAEKYYNG